jgi:hypothetical protein
MLGYNTGKVLAQAIFEPNLFPYYTPTFLKRSSFYTHLPAYGDGTDRVFRNVGIQTSDAGELPRRKHTTFRTRRKFEIKNLPYATASSSKIFFAVARLAKKNLPAFFL